MDVSVNKALNCQLLPINAKMGVRRETANHIGEQLKECVFVKKGYKIQQENV